MGRNKQRSRVATFVRYAGIVTVVIVAFSATGCGALGQIADEIEKTRKVLQDAINKMEAGTYNATKVVEEALRDLPTQVDETIRGELTNLAQNTLVSANEGLKCDYDFVREGLCLTLGGCLEISIQIVLLTIRRSHIFAMQYRTTSISI